MKLSHADIEAKLKSRDGWVLLGDAIVREFAFKSFPDAIAFTTRLAFSAEAADHHPDLQISYKKVRVNWSTHSAGGVTDKDFAGAKEADRIADQFAPQK